MSTPVATIVSDAYREMNIVAIGLAPTTAQQNEALTLLNDIIRGVYDTEIGERLYDWQVPQPQRTAQVAANYPQLPYPLNTDSTILPFPMTTEQDLFITPFPPKNSRMVWGGQTMTIYMPEQPDNGSRMMLVQGSGKGDAGIDGNVATIDGNGRYVGAIGQSQATYTFSFETGFQSVSWIYISPTGVWTPVVDLALTDVMIFPRKHDTYFKTALAIRLAPRYNKAISKETGAAFTAAEAALKTDYRQTGVTVYGSQDFPRSLQSFVQGKWLY